MKEFVKEHPFLTFFIATSAISGVVEIVRILKRPANAWPMSSRCDGIPGLLSFHRGCGSEPSSLTFGDPGPTCGPIDPHTGMIAMYPTAAAARRATFAAGVSPSPCAPGSVLDPHTGNCVSMPTTPPFGQM